MVVNDRRSPINGVPLPKGKPFEPGERAREIGKRGGQKTQEKKKELRTLKEELLMLLAEEKPGKDGKPMTVQAGITSSLVAQAVKGNIRAYEIIRDTIGQKPMEQVEVFTPKAEAVLQLERDLSGD